MTTINTIVIHKRDEHKYPKDKLVYIGRPSVYENPFVIGKDGNREEIINKFKKYFSNRIMEDLDFRKKAVLLNDKVLVCWCKPNACHGDVIAWYCNNGWLSMGKNNEL